MINRNRVDWIDTLKGIAILSVICAHCNGVPANMAGFPGFCAVLLSNLGTAGVICFFVLSGYLFHYKQGKAHIFWMNKLRGILLPWFISASCVYLYVYLRKPPVTLLSYSKFLLGNGSYCYYMTILMVLYLLFGLIPFLRSNAGCIICMLVTFLSACFFYKLPILTPFLNVFNWIGYFALGYYFQQEKNKVPWCNEKLTGFRWGLYIVTVISILYRAAMDRDGYYWGEFAFITSILAAASFFVISLAINKKGKLGEGLMYIGRISFFIYLWHMPIAGITSNLMNRGILVYAVLLRPFIVLIIMEAAASIAVRLLKSSKCCGLLTAIGLNR